MVVLGIIKYVCTVRRMLDNAIIYTNQSASSGDLSFIFEIHYDSQFVFLSCSV